MVEGEIKRHKLDTDPEARGQMLKNALDLHQKSKQQELEREKKLITSEYA